MNTQTDTPLPLPGAALIPSVKKPRRVEVPTLDDDDDQSEPGFEDGEALQNMWQRNSF
jgi:hypothetical protein